MEKTVSSVLVFSTLLSLVLGAGLAYSAEEEFLRLGAKESEIVARIDGPSAYNYDLGLEEIAFDHSFSNYAFRSGGSVGATETAKWIKRQFESFGLETTLESFNFTTWDLPSQPSLVIYDGDGGTESNQTVIKSFQSTHFSWPTPEGGESRDLVILPLPEKVSRTSISMRISYDVAAWNALNATGKILLIGYELRWNQIWHQAFWNKLKQEPPAAIIYTWWYPWMSGSPPSFTSVGGLPAGDRGPYYWQLKIPVGWVNYEDGLTIREREQSMNVSASLAIPAVIRTCPHYNVVGKLKSQVNPDKSVIISSHYDTIMASGFCDNGAGTAGVLELARVFAGAAKEGLYTPDYTLVFVAFASEELGLVGSINYVKQHADEMKNVVAVLNLDCIGSDVFHVTETFTDDNGLDLDELVVKAARDLGIEAVLEEGGVAGDEFTFRVPKMATDFYEKAWSLKAGIGSVARVKSSTTLISFPLFFNDEWENKTRAIGWIHTQYDNSTSTATLSWVKVDDLEVQIQVAALSIMRIPSALSRTSLSLILVATVVMSGVFVVLVSFRRSMVSAALKKVHGNVVNLIEMKEWVLITVLVGLFLFLSIISYTRVGRIEAVKDDVPTPVTMLYLGYPFEMIAFEQSATLIGSGASEGAAPLESLGSNVVGTQVFWSGLFLDLLVYFLSALALVYVAARLRRRE